MKFVATPKILSSNFEKKIWLGFYSWFAFFFWQHFFLACVLQLICNIFLKKIRKIFGNFFSRPQFLAWVLHVIFEKILNRLKIFLRSLIRFLSWKFKWDMRAQSCAHYILLWKTTLLQKWPKKKIYFFLKSNILCLMCANHT